ncbi:PAS domain-containing protein [Gillisia sp. M10.2A]|uniref:histidine kinase n=1 Tax=Gillisia lutea TaxID=2909668 RepID=A0ABS9EFM9_9FLAO|nr:PAS domain-containing protein [Gillisia lutea]MCF4101651.1 PAS domain-containing protein [Gillisia lutea]
MIKDHSIFRNLPMPCLLVEPKNGVFIIKDANTAYCQVTQKDIEAIVDKTIPSIIKDDANYIETNWKRVHDELTQIVESGVKPEKFIIRYDPLDSSLNQINEKYWEVEFVAFGSPVEEIIIFYHDKTVEVLKERERLRMQTQLDENLNERKHFVESNPNGLYSLDKNGRFLSVNEGLANITQTPEEELLNMDFLPFCTPYYKDQILSYFEKALSGENQIFEADFISAKGRVMVLEISIVPIRVQGEITGVYGIARDLTSLRNSEKVIIEKSNYLKFNGAILRFLVDHDLNSEILQDIFPQIAKTVQADRMYYFGHRLETQSGEILINKIVEWSDEGSFLNNNFPTIQSLSLDEMREILGELIPGEEYTAITSELPDGKLKNIFTNQNVKSILIIPIFLNDQIYGYIGFDDCTKERKWTEDEKTFLKNLAQNITTFVEKKLAEITIKKQEEELIRSVKKFKTLVQEGSDFISILELSGVLTFVSDTHASILGIPEKELLGNNFMKFVYPEDQERTFIEYSKISYKQKVHIEPFRFKDGFGKWRWIETTLTNLINDPNVNGIVANSKEVTEIIERNREIKELNERYRLAAYATDNLMYDWNLENDEAVRFYNGNEKLFGHTPEEIDKREFWRNHVHPEELEALSVQLKETLEDPGKNLIKTKYRFRRADGSYAHLIDRAYILRDLQGKATRLIGATSDISEIVDKKNALRLANKRFRYAVKATQEMIWDWDLLNDHIVRSKSSKKLYGYELTKTSSINDLWLSKIMDEDRDQVIKSLKAAIDNKKLRKWKEEYRLIKSNGEVAFLIDRGYIVRDSTGKAIRMIGAVLDVTESRRLIKEINKQNKVLKQVAWDQAHVVRGPLTRLKSLLMLLEEESYEEWSREELLNLINDAADELDKIVINIINKAEEIGI